MTLVALASALLGVGACGGAAQEHRDGGRCRYQQVDRPCRLADHRVLDDGSESGRFVIEGRFRGSFAADAVGRFEGPAADLGATVVELQIDGARCRGRTRVSGTCAPGRLLAERPPDH